ncbi:hypothetical protein DFH28DRAFT_1118966 [Melampsora americana]|nr:hypothetical protein DFH28DRAFT_1118966 [Melampsora americana]
MVSIPIPQELKHDEDQFTPTTLQRPLQLLSLPVEIIEQIIQFAHHFDNLERSEEIIKNSPHSSQSKINKSFISRISSISLVNRGLYQLSCPILWKNLRILGIGFIPLQLALHEIFPKYGQFIKSLKITLSARELKSLSFQNGLDNFQLLLSAYLKST